MVSNTLEPENSSSTNPPAVDAYVIWPRVFARDLANQQVDPFLGDPAIAKLADFFWTKGLGAIKEEDRREQWYQDWLDYQAKHHLYASVLSPKQYSSLGNQFSLLRLTRFMEAFAYFSPSHGYSLQVSFLGLYPILMGSNEALKREAVAALEAGGLFALGVSEKEHGSDLLSNEFSVTQIAPAGAVPGPFVANGRKYYIGNSNCAAIISILGRKNRQGNNPPGTGERRSPFVFVGLRPATSLGYRNIKKIRTLGVRAAFVGEFEVKDQPIPASDFIAEGREAWDAVFGTVTLGKFFLGFGSIGMCEHAMEEAIAHLHSRVLYRKCVLEMSHIRLAIAQAYARLLAMKLYAYRALDYVQAASAMDRRYLLFCAVQKSKVSTEGVKVISQLSECIGAKGFESETYFESALRDTQLIPGLEGSKHINLGLTAQFIKRYFSRQRPQVRESSINTKNNQTEPASPKSLARGDMAAVENPYLMHPRSGGSADIAFAHFLDAYRPFKGISNVRRFMRQAKRFARLIRVRRENPRSETAPAIGHGADASKASAESKLADIRITLCLGQCMATIAFAQLIAENAMLFGIPSPLISAMFHLLVSDLSDSARELAASPGIDVATRARARRLIAIPNTADSDWDCVMDQANSLKGG